MPQQDRHKDRMIPLEFDFYDTLTELPKSDRCSVVLITCGSATLKINNRIRLLNSPCVLCLFKYDEIEEAYRYDRKMLYMFTRHHDNFQGVFWLLPQNYIHLNELMLLIGAEVYSQSDGFWTCRIRRIYSDPLCRRHYLDGFMRLCKSESNLPESKIQATIFLHLHGISVELPPENCAGASVQYQYENG